MRLDEFYNPEQDQSVKIASTDTRKNRLTLKDIRRLRRYRDIKRQEKLDHDKFVKTMYGAGTDSEPEF